MLIQAVQAWNAPGINRQMTNFYCLGLNEQHYMPVTCCHFTLLTLLCWKVSHLSFIWMLWIRLWVFLFFFFLISKIHPANLLCQLLLWCWSTSTCDGGCVLVMLQACMQKLEVEEKKVGSWCHENRERILPAHSGSHLSFYLKIFAEPNVQVHLSSSIWTTLTVIIPEVKTASCLGQFSNANGKQYLSSSLVLGKVI